MTRLIASTLLALGFAAPLAAAPTIPLDATPHAFTIPAGSSTDSFYIDVGPEANVLEVRLDAQSPASADVDLLLRYGSPFPDPGTSATDVNYLFDLAQYRSASSTGTESLVIGKSNVYPVRQGRWYVSVINFASTQVGATLRASTSTQIPTSLPIEVVFNDTSDDCDVSGWNDSTSRAAAGGNTGTTLGQQRQNALREAARLLGTQLKSPVPIRVQACWEDLGGGNSVTLAHAGPSDIHINEKYLPRNQTFYAGTPATKLGGTGACGLSGGPCGTSFDVRAGFNTQIDTPNALGSAGFYYGFTPVSGFTNDVDFIAVAMHEITHGLGFLSLVNVDAADGPVGEKPNGFDDIYAANIVAVDADGFQYKRFTEISDAERAAAMTSNVNLRWDGTEAVTSFLNPFGSSPAPDNFVRLHAPTTLAPGSTLSHIGLAYPGEIMRASASGSQRTIGIAAPMLNAMGWSDLPATPKTEVVPPNGMYFDVSHPGHGVGFTRVADNVYFLAFYTYDDAGAPEWYIAIGPVVDGVFTPAANANGDSLVKYKYVNGAPTPQQADATVQGFVRVDFNQAGLAPACNDGQTHDKSGALGVMSFVLAPRSAQNPPLQRWCMQPLIPASLATTPDFTGTWYGGPSDSGWGFSLASFAGSPKALFGVLYYPDANGNGRWAYLISSNFANGTQMNLVERHGYCRTCAVPAAVQAGQFDDRNAGTITLNLNSAVQNQSAGAGTFSLNYQLAPGGAFARAGFPMTLLSTPPGI
jgi:hypothetical protein